MDIEKEKLESQLGKIIESDLFSRSNVNISLLKLLFYSNLEGRKLKETTIGSEIFGSSYDPVKNDTKVRVYVHNLRKKLTAYYSGTGSADEIIFEIEKGHYQISYTKREKSSFTIWRKNRIISLSFLAILFVCVFFFIVKTGQHKASLWTGFINKSFPTTVLIGDHFTIETSLPTGGYGVIRDFSINSEKDFTERIQEHPELAPKMLPNRYPYITKMGPFCTKFLSEFLSDKGISFDLMLSSEWDKTTVNTSNVIYVGQYKTMGFIENIFNETSSKFRIVNSRVEILNEDEKSKQVYASEDGDQIIDYTLVSHLKGEQGNDIVLFVSDHDVGVIHVVDYFTTVDSIQAFYERNQFSEKGFNGLFKVSGWERTGVKMELVAVESR